jgi:hypothetical protein
MAKFSKNNQPEKRGRKKGSVNQTTKILRDATPEILNKLIEQAKAGDFQASQLILRYALPPKKPEYTPISINFTNDMSWNEKAQAVANSALNGECCPSLAIEMIKALALLDDTIKLDSTIEAEKEKQKFQKLFSF